MNIRIYSFAQVCKMLGISRSTLWRRIGAGAFPEPIELTPGRKGFLAEEVEAWIAARAADRGRSR